MTGPPIMLPTDSASPSWPVHCKLTGLYPPVDCLAPVQWRAKLRRGDVSLLGEVLRRMRCVGGGNYAGSQFWPSSVWRRRASGRQTREGDRLALLRCGDRRQPEVWTCRPQIARITCRRRHRQACPAADKLERCPAKSQRCRYRRTTALRAKLRQGPAH